MNTGQRFFDRVDMRPAACAARIGHRAAELLIEFPEATVDDCLRAAEWEERFIHGAPDALNRCAAGLSVAAERAVVDGPTSA